MKEYDRAGLTTAKSRRANGIIASEQLSFNNRTTNELAELQDNLESLEGDVH